MGGWNWRGGDPPKPGELVSMEDIDRLRRDREIMREAAYKAEARAKEAETQAAALSVQVTSLSREVGALRSQSPVAVDPDQASAISNLHAALVDAKALDERRVARITELVTGLGDTRAALAQADEISERRAKRLIELEAGLQMAQSERDAAVKGRDRARKCQRALFERFALPRRQVTGTIDALALLDEAIDRLASANAPKPARYDTPMVADVPGPALDPRRFMA